MNALTRTYAMPAHITRDLHTLEADIISPELDVWGRPVMQPGDGHSAWACNNRSCSDHPAALYGKGA